ncbi:MAG TPA: substrate-binding domain-containing protein [Novosphingobium sp.]|nr:substrate-binding domain-containing protein [Novosphingobium sp.]
MLASALLLAPALLPAPAGAELAPPQPMRPAGTLVIATSAALAPALRRAAHRFEAAHAGVHVLILGQGSDVAMARLYTGQADAAVIGRDASDNEIKAYAWIYGHAPQAEALGAGSRATPGLSPALAVIVAARSPLRAMTLEDLRQALATAPGPFHIVMPDAQSGTGRFLRHRLHQDAAQFYWPRVREIAPPAPGQAGRDGEIDRAIATAVAADPKALGFAAAPRRPGLRVLPIRAGGRLLRPADRDYPLRRTIMAYRPVGAQPLLIAYLACLRGVFPPAS